MLRLPAKAQGIVVTATTEALKSKGVDYTEEMEWGWHAVTSGIINVGTLVSLHRKNHGLEGIEDKSELIHAGLWLATAAQTIGIITHPRVTVSTVGAGMLADHEYHFRCEFPFIKPRSLNIDIDAHAEWTWLAFGLAVEGVQCEVTAALAESERLLH